MATEPRCDEVQAELSNRLDGVATVDDAVIDAHVTHCAACRRFEIGAQRLRQQLRYESVEVVPDVADVVTARLADDLAYDVAADDDSRDAPARRRLSARLLAVAAAFVVGALVGALLVTDRGTGPGPPAAAGVADQIVASQFQLSGLDAEVSLVERGWHTDVPERRWRGRLAWSAPEQLSFALEDQTAYPSSDWVADDVKLVIDDDRRATVGPRDCPAEAQPLCTRADARVDVTTGREPFADDAPVPLDLVLPVASFAGAAEPEVVGERTIAGRTALGLATTAAQVRPMIDGLRPSGNLRDVHPTDPVELWLDRETMVPLALDVRVGDAPGRATWATNRGYVDRLDQVILELRVETITFGDVHPEVGLVSDEATDDAGFIDGPVPTMLTATAVPLGFAPHRSGTVTGDGPAVDVATWTDGRAWIKVRSTTDWSGGRLFGGLGPLVRPTALDSGGVAYLSDRGDRLAVHSAFLDVVVSGTVDESILLSVASSLGVSGEAVPSTWDESVTADRSEAVAVVPDLVLPTDLEGFRPPAYRVEDTAVTVRYAGPGDRSFTVVEVPGRRLSPPLDASVIGVEVRGGDGRWSEARHELEWVEDELVITLRSESLPLDELLAVADSMRRP